VKVVGYWWGKPNFEEEKKQVDRYFINGEFYGNFVKIHCIGTIRILTNKNVNFVQVSIYILYFNNFSNNNMTRVK
jgi:hypothetical protein